MKPFPICGQKDTVAVGGEGARRGSDLHAAAGAIAAALASRSEVDVVLACEDRYHFAAALLGAWTARRRVILPPNTQQAALDEMGKSHRALLVHDRAGETAGCDVRALMQAGPALPVEMPPGDREVALVATSGSTGPSRGHAKTLDQLLREVRAHGRLFDIGPGHCFLVMAPPHHIYGLLFGVLLPLQSGAAIVRTTALHPEAVIEAVERHGVTHVVSVPAQLRAMTASDALPPVARVFSSAGPLPREVSRDLARLGWAVTEIFGSSETGGIAYREEGRGLWRLLPDIRAAVAEDGRLSIVSPFLHPSDPIPYPTNDLARSTEQGFEFLGRMDDVVKAGGKRVSMREVEDRAKAIPGVLDASAHAVELGGARGQGIWLAVASQERTQEQIRGELARWLDPAVLPRRIRVVGTLPRSETGKLPRAAFLSLFEKQTVWHLEPERETALPTGGGREGVSLAFSLPSDLGWFDGHFPDKAILAGVVQLQELVIRQARRRWSRLGAPRRVLRLKYKRIISPGDPLEVRLAHAPAELRVDFEILSGSRSCASGTVEFGGARAEPTP